MGLGWRMRTQLEQMQALRVFSVCQFCLHLWASVPNTARGYQPENEGLLEGQKGACRKLGKRKPSNDCPF